MRKGKLVLTEEEFSVLLETLPIPLLLVDRGGKIIYLNKLALTSAYLRGCCNGSLFDDFFSSSQHDSLFSHLVNGCDGGQGPVHIELTMRESGTGDCDQFHLTAKSFEGFLLVQLEQRPKVSSSSEFDPQTVIGSYKMELIGRLVNGIAHDFNNILGVLYGYLEMAMEECEHLGMVSSYLKQVERSADKMRDLVQHILLLSHKNDDTNRLFNLVFETMEVVKFLKSAFPSSITFECVWPDQELAVWANVSQWRLVLFNIFLNAGEALPNGGTIHLLIKKIKFDAIMAEKLAIKPGQFAMVLIQDSGPGMNPSVLSGVCEPYFTSNPIGKSNGLGLSMALDIIRKQGGSISITSEAGRGTRVEIYMPLMP